MKNKEYKIIFDGFEINLEQLPRGKFKKPDLANIFKGTKYSIAPLKQTMEVILVLKKPTKTGSVLNDLFEYGQDIEERGVSNISPSVLNIEAGRVPINVDTDDPRIQKDYKHKAKAGLENGSSKDNSSGEVQTLHNTKGRYPSQTFMSSDAKSVVDKQSGELTSGSTKDTYIIKGSENIAMSGKNYSRPMINRDSDSGGASRINHTCDYEKQEFDLAVYCPKVSGSERNYGLDGFEDQERVPRGSNQGVRVCSSCQKTDNNSNNHSKCKGDFNYRLCQSFKNDHPTLKPIKLIYEIMKLHSLPTSVNQKLYIPFSGSGSEIIGSIFAGINPDNIEACEINPEYVEISKARIEAWSKLYKEGYVLGSKEIKNKTTKKKEKEKESIWN